jgi:leader peptidase (prepilin peptidase)/N-methyltransferase
MTNELAWLYGITFIFALCVGSFLNVVIYRLPIMMKRQWLQDSQDIQQQLQDPIYHSQERFNLSLPNSACPHCGHQIRPWENIPVISYLLLKGRCSGCKAAISKRYPSVEFCTALLALLPLYTYGISLQALFAIVAIFALVALTMIDLDEQLLPDSLTLPLLWAGLLINSFGVYCSLEEAVWGAAAGYLSLWSVYWLFKLATGKEGMGYGDFKLLAALGAWTGWKMLPLIILGSSFVGMIIGIAMVMLVKHDRRKPIPFGPYLAIAGLITLLWGDPLMDAYLLFALGSNS